MHVICLCNFPAFEYVTSMQITISGHAECVSPVVHIWPPLTCELSSDLWHMQLLPCRIGIHLWISLVLFDYRKLIMQQCSSLMQSISEWAMLTCHIIIFTQDSINQLEENERRFEVLIAMNINPSAPEFYI